VFNLPDRLISFGWARRTQARHWLSGCLPLFLQLPKTPVSFFTVSTTAIQQVLDELRALPESGQNLVLGFLQASRRKHNSNPTTTRRLGRNQALELNDSTLVFTGQVDDPQTNWLQIVRDEREAESYAPQRATPDTSESVL
jgi:hypothetical protein